jgi:hypothetical protein
MENFEINRTFPKMFKVKYEQNKLNKNYAVML